MEYEVEGSRPRGRPKRTWKEIVREDCQTRKLNKEDAVDRCKWRKVIQEVRWPGWVWAGECFFWYRPTRVVPDKRPLNGWIFKDSKFLWTIPCRGPICVTVPNLIKIGQTVAEIWRFNGFFKMAVARHLGFAGRLLGPSTTTTWWAPSLCKIWSKSMQEFW